MEINISNLDPEKQQRIKTIVELGQMFGGTPEMDEYLIGQLMNVYLPEEETSDIDKLASAYSLTEDEDIRELLNQELYKDLGIEQNQTGMTGLDEEIYSPLFESFANQYSTDKGNRQQALENAKYQQLMKENPQALEQFYGYQQPNRSLGQSIEDLGGVWGTLKKSPYTLLSQMFGGETKDQERKRLESLLQQYQSNIPKN